MSGAKKTTALTVVPTKPENKSETVRQVIANNPKVTSAREIAKLAGTSPMLVHAVKAQLRKKEARSGTALVPQGRPRRLRHDDGVMVESAVSRDGEPVLMLKASPEIHGLVFSDLVARIRKHVHG